MMGVTLFSMMCYFNMIYDGIMVMNKGCDVVERIELMEINLGFIN
jgi:hypothetical protein